MSAELSIVSGLGIISALLGYFAFELRESHETLAWLMFFLSMTFLDILSLVVSKIADQSASYIGFVQIGLTILLWMNILIAIYIAFGMLSKVIFGTYQWVVDRIAGRRRDRE